MRRLLAGAREDGQPLTHAEHVALHGPLPEGGRHHDARLLASLQDAGLRGRGGGGFPVARKIAVTRDAGGKGPVIVNVTESEPASAKDTALATLVPHLVLDGAHLARRLVRGRDVVLATHQGSPAGPTLAAALRERPELSGIRLLEVPQRYVSGEASSLARAAAGGPALPVLHPQPLAVSGPTGRPTLVLNAESVADLALYLRHGKAWYDGLGTADEPGTVLLTVRGELTAPRVLEVPLGTSVGTVLASAGIASDDLQAVLLGGYFGRWLPVPEALDVPLSHAGARAAGGVLGAGVLIALDRQHCGLRATAAATRYLVSQRAGQCGPCTNGLPALSRALDELAAGVDPDAALAQVRHYLPVVRRRGLCGLPDGTADFVESALAVFAEDVDTHRLGGCGRPAGHALAVPPAAPLVEAPGVR